MNLLSLCRHVTNTRDYAAGETIFVEGKARDVMYVILEGEVDIQVHDQSIYTAGPGELLGEMAMIDAQSRSASAVALSPCRLASVDEKRFLFMVQETPHFALHVMRNPAQKLHQFLSSGLPRSGMEFSSKFPLRLWLAKPPLFRGANTLLRSPRPDILAQRHFW